MHCQRSPTVFEDCDLTWLPQLPLPEPNRLGTRASLGRKRVMDLLEGSPQPNKTREFNLSSNRQSMKQRALNENG